MDINETGNGNENSINQQKNIITTSEEHLIDAMGEAYDYMRKSLNQSIKVSQCDDSIIFFEIHLEYGIAITTIILEILNHKFKRFHIYGMRGSKNSKDVMFECRVD